ncbi:MAG: response regulator transcription factor [Candidatus Saccharicenans sp.]|nr:response regulator transcription factor [Candidatus Saccharicenans sp.]
MRILVIEDERKIAEFIRRGLKEEGYSVDVAYDGEQGYRLARINEYDLIILDLMLPGLNGLEICRQLRQDKLTVPILILTVKDSVQDKVTGLDSGANDYLTKPFAFEELLARCRALLRGYGVSEPTRLRVADLELDLLTRRVTRAGQEISLTQKENSLLEYLMRNAGRVVTRTMIAEHVWDMNFDSFTNVIEVYINRLRNKIDRGFNRPLIHTIRGRGYILKE